MSRLTNANITCCLALVGWVLPGCDIDDTSPETATTELNGTSGALDEEIMLPAECDRDGDGFGVCDGDAPRDCDDNEWYTNPAEDELCDGRDNDCDGDVDELITGCATASIPGPPAANEAQVPFDGPQADRPEPSADSSWPADCADADEDGWPACDTDSGTAQDCDDREWYTNPAQDELCDGADNDCDGEIDEYITGCETASIPGVPAAD